MARNIIDSISAGDIEFVAWRYDGGYQLKIVGADVAIARIEKVQGSWVVTRLADRTQDENTYRTLHQAIAATASAVHAEREQLAAELVSEETTHPLVSEPQLYLIAETKGSFYRHLTTVGRRERGSTTALCGLKDIGVPRHAAAVGVSRQTSLECIVIGNEGGLPFCPHCTEVVEAGAL